MPIITDSTGQINVLFRPVGFKATGERKATPEEIIDWKKDKDLSIIQKQSFLTIAGLLGTIVGLVAGLIGFKKDSALGKWSGIGLAIVGFLGTVVGGFVDMQIAEEAKDAEPMLEKADERTDREKFLEEIKEIMDRNLSSGFSDYIDYTAGPNSNGDEYVKSVNVLIEKYSKQKVLDWVNEIVDRNRIPEIDTIKHYETSYTKQLEKIYSALLCSAIIADDSITEKLFQFIKDPKLSDPVKECSFLGLTLREILVKKDSKITLKFIDLLKDKEHFIYKMAVIALGNIKDKLAIEPLTKLFNDPIVEISEEAARALGKIRDPEAISALAYFFNHGGNKGYVQGIASLALEKDVNYSVECLMNTLDKYYRGEIQEEPRDEGYLLCWLLKDELHEGSKKNEELKKSASKWAYEIIDKYYDKKEGKDFCTIFQILLLPLSKTKEDIQYLVEIATRYHDRKIRDYNPIISYIEDHLGKDAVTDFCRGMVEAHRTGKIKNRPEYEITHLERVIGKRETAKLLKCPNQKNPSRAKK